MLVCVRQEMLLVNDGPCVVVTWELVRTAEP